MNLTCTQLETSIALDAARPFVLHIENPHMFYQTVQQLVNAFDGKVSEFTFWDGVEQLAAEKVGMILTDMVTFSFTDRKIISLLHKHLQKNFTDGTLLPQFMEVGAQVDRFVYDLCATLDFQTEHDALTLEALLKMCAVRPSVDYDNLLEKIVCYLNILTQLQGIYVVAFVGLKNVLSDTDLQQLYRHCALHKIALLLIEGQKVRPLLQEECAIIITEDLCELLENFSDI